MTVRKVELGHWDRGSGTVPVWESWAGAESTTAEDEDAGPATGRSQHCVSRCTSPRKLSFGNGCGEENKMSHRLRLSGRHSSLHGVASPAERLGRTAGSWRGRSALVPVFLLEAHECFLPLPEIYSTLINF